MLPLLVIFGIIYPSSSADYKVCNGCADNVDCDPLLDGIEECVLLGEHDEKICYWRDGVFDIDANSPPRNRKCVTDNDCDIFDAMSTRLGGYDSRFQYGCLRCCNNEDLSIKLCTETVSTLQEPCGDRNVANQQAPCCRGEVCLDNYAGICAALVGECEKCFSFAVVTVQFDTIGMGDNCIEGYFCLTEESRVLSDVETDDSDEMEQIFYDGVCIPENRISQTVSECTVNENCPPCMRCCKNQCVRANGENCGFRIEGRGPCCCPEHECKLNECITQSPTQAPITQEPTTQEPTTQERTIKYTKSPTKDD